MSDHYSGPPDYDDEIPLGAEPAYGVPASSEGIVGYGDPRHEYARIADVPGATNLRPFPDASEGCSGETVPSRVPCYPHCEVRQRGLRVFSLWGDRSGGTSGTLLRRETPPNWESYLLVESAIVPDGGSQFWSVDVWGYEIRRIVEAAGGPVGPVPAGDLPKVGGASALNFGGNFASMLKVRVNWGAASGGSSRILDVAEGIRFAVEGCYVSVEILYPMPGIIALDTVPPPTLAPLGGLVLDSLIGVQICPTISTPGNQLGTNTITVQVLAGQADVPVLIPPGTRSLSIFQTADGTVMVPTWSDGRLPSSAGQSVGQVTLGGARRVDRISRPGNAGMLLTGPADPDFDRWATFIFELEI